jgi:formyltetrahydrofolate hydrolase
MAANAPYDVPFHHLAVTPASKPVQEAKLAALIEQTGADVVVGDKTVVFR